ncbi:MAG: hypothetical protein QM598_13815 [Protaetiibacter sp.]
MRRADLTRPFRGVRETILSTGVRERCAAYQTIMRSDAYFCGPTAALLWGLPLPRRLELDEPLHVGLPHGHRATRLTGTVGHHFVITSAELTVFDGMPITTPARTWCDLAPYLGLEDLVAAGDRVIWRRDPLATLTDLYEMARVHPGRRGALVRATALPKLNERSDARSETQLRLRFAAAGLPPMVANHEVRRNGRLIAEIDLASVEFRVGIDHEGDHHRTDQAQWRRDLRRFVELENDSWSMIRSTADDLHDTSHLIDTVAIRLRRRGWIG